MTIMNLTFISLFLTIALIVALISFIIVFKLNKKLTRAKNDVENINDDIESNIAMLVTNQLVNRLNGVFELKNLPKGEKIYYMKLPLSNDKNNQTMDSITNLIEIKTEVQNKAVSETEANNNIRTNVDPDFLNRVNSIIYREITNTDNIIEIISSELCISSSQLNRRIKLMTGMTTSNFILKTRLNRAKKQLTLTQKPIGEIAMECGFNDFAYFSRSFKKEFEMTPTTFQRIPHSVNVYENKY